MNYNKLALISSFLRLELPSLSFIPLAKVKADRQGLGSANGMLGYRPDMCRGAYCTQTQKSHEVETHGRHTTATNVASEHMLQDRLGEVSFTIQKLHSTLVSFMIECALLSTASI